MSDDSKLKAVFLQFCDSVKKGSTTATDKTITRICKDCKIYTKTFDSNRCDIEFRGFVGNSKKDVDFVKFKEFIETRFSKSYATAMNMDQNGAADMIKEKIINSGGPIGHGTTKVSTDAATQRLTDVKSYTGSHKERFDSNSGKGKGKDGREYLPDAKAQAGYVSGYKEMDTYDVKNDKK